MSLLRLRLLVLVLASFPMVSLWAQSQRGTIVDPRETPRTTLLDHLRDEFRKGTRPDLSELPEWKAGRYVGVDRPQSAFAALIRVARQEEAPGLPPIVKIKFWELFGVQGNEHFDRLGFFGRRRKNREARETERWISRVQVGEDALFWRESNIKDGPWTRWNTWDFVLRKSGDRLIVEASIKGELKGYATLFKNPVGR